MTTIYYDESGELQSGCFYELLVPLDLDTEASGVATSERIVSECSRDVIYGETVDRSEKVEYNCPVDPSHDTDHTVTAVSVDITGGRTLDDFVPDVTNLSTLISKRFWNRLKGSGLTGARASAALINVNQTSIEVPEVFWITATDNRCVRRYSRNIPTRNSCRNCGFGPIVCPRCSFLHFWCPQCKRRLIYSEKDVPDGTDELTIALPPTKGFIVDGNEWDGCDFVSGHNKLFVTKRGINWMLSVHAGPFIAKPARVDVQNMTRANRDKLAVE